MSMTKRDHLTATPTVDKNGKATTVYRRNGQGSKDAKSFPSPSAVHRIELNRKVSLALLDGGWNEARTRRHVVDFVSKLSNETVTRIDRMLESAGGDRDKLAKQIREYLDQNRDFEFGFEAKLNHNLWFYPVISDVAHSVVRDIIKSLKYYEQLPPMENFTYDDEAMKKCVALLRVFDAAYGTVLESELMINGLYYTLEDDQLVELILDNPERSELIAATVRERGTIDAELLSVVVHSEASALGNGTL